MKATKGAFAHLFCGAIFATSLVAASARADIVDDLLAGKPANDSDAAANESPADSSSAAPAAADRVIVSQETHSVDDGTPLHVNLPASVITPEASEHHLIGPPAPMNLVPEPSAVVLASLALAYFFVFFRRRYA